MSSATECVQVMVRCRPMNVKEEGDKRASIVNMEPSNGQVFLKNPRSEEMKQFTFDAVFDGLASQESVFATVAQPIIDSAMNGYNGTIFAYGQTGTGKTHTMEGQPSDELKGIIPRSFDYIFSSIQDSGDAKYLIRASFLEIYNEAIRDLLAPGAAKHESNRGLGLRENRDRGVFVAGLRSEVVESVPAMLDLLKVSCSQQIPPLSCLHSCNGLEVGSSSCCPAASLCRKEMRAAQLAQH
jgi:kinesin family member 3B